MKTTLFKKNTIVIIFLETY